LVESDEVFAIAGSLGTPTNVAIQKYLNSKWVPNLYLTSGSDRFSDPKDFPWIIPFFPTYAAQGALFARYILEHRPSARIAVQYENDDLGRDYLTDLKRALGAKALEMIVKELSHELSDPTIDAQIIDFKASGADVLVPVYPVEIRRPGDPPGWPGLASASYRGLECQLHRQHIYSVRRRCFKGRDYGGLGAEPGRPCTNGLSGRQGFQGVCGTLYARSRHEQCDCSNGLQ
jgi:hypothetical protein